MRRTEGLWALHRLRPLTCPTPPPAQGPTLTFRIHQYSLIKDVQNAAVRPRVPANAFKSAPLVVMNSFGSEEHMRLATTMFQHLFPSINVQTVKLASCQRVVLLHHDKETGRISFRHYR